MTLRGRLEQDVLRVGIVAEGPTDFLVLKAIIAQLLAPRQVECRRIHPDEVMGSPFGNGWDGVRRWCRDYGPTLERFMRDITSDILHVLVLHVDGDVASEAEINVAQSCPPARPTADALRRVIYQDWLQRDPPPSFVVLATPMVDTETWVVAAVATEGQVLCECDAKISQALVRMKLLRTKNGKLKKNQIAYRPLAEQTGAQLKRIRISCTEADRFCQDLVSAVAINSTGHEPEGADAHTGDEPRPIPLE